MNGLIILGIAVVAAIDDLVKLKIFIIEAEIASTENGKSITLYRHRDGSKIKSGVIEDDSDFY